jgi:hypothetical protein
MTLAFFRRHRKWFMVLMIAAVVSMVFFQAWIYMGPRIKQWFAGNASGPVVGTIHGRKVTQEELNTFYVDIVRAGQFSQTWAMLLDRMATTPESRNALYRATVGSSTMAMKQVAEAFRSEKMSTKAILTWMALYEEARAAGFDTSEAQVTERLQTIQALGMPPSEMGQMINLWAEGRPEKLVSALRTDMTLRAYVDWLGESMAGAVTPELRKEFVKADDRLMVRLAVLKASDYLKDVKDIPEETLAKLFKDNKEFLLGKGPEGLGYRIPDKVALEYIVTVPAAFESQVKDAVTEAEIQAYYDARKDPEFVVEPTPAAPIAPKPEAIMTPPAAVQTGAKGDAGPTGPTAPVATPTTVPAKAAAPASTAAPVVTATAAVPAPTSTAVQPPAKKFLPLVVVREKIRQILMRDKAARLALEKLHSDVAEIRKLKTPSLAIWADGKQIKYVSLPGFRSNEQLSDMAIGKAVRRSQSGQTDSLAADALSIKELIGEKAALAVGEISDPYIGADSESYAFRVTAVQANHAPADLAEVRDQVVADARRIRALEIAREKAKAILDEAATKGLEAAGKAAGVTVAESKWFPQEIVFQFPIDGKLLTQPPSLPEVGADEKVVAECFRMAAENKKFSQMTLAGKEMSVVIELLGHKGPREAVFEQQRPTLALEVGWTLGNEALKKAIALESIQARMDVVLVGSDEFHAPRGSKSVAQEDDGF